MELKEITTYNYKGDEKVVHENYFVDLKGNRQGEYKDFYKSGRIFVNCFYKNNRQNGKNDLYTYYDSHVKIESNFFKNGLWFGQSFYKRLSY